MRAIDIHIRRDYYFVELEAFLVELRDVLRQFLASDLDAASHDADEVHDDVRCKNALQGRLLNVEDLAPDRHERLVLRVARSQQAAQSGIALADEELSSLRVLAATVDELLDLVRDVRLLHQLLLDRDALALGLLAAPLVDQHLFDYLVSIRLVLDEPYLQVGLDQVCQELLDELVVDRLLGLVLVRCLCRERVGDQDQAVLDIAEGQLGFLGSVPVACLELFIEGRDESALDCLVRRPAVLEVR